MNIQIQKLIEQSGLTPTDFSDGRGELIVQLVKDTIQESINALEQLDFGSGDSWDAALRSGIEALKAHFEV